jgi:hypothetical protein
MIISLLRIILGYAMVQLAEALLYHPEGRKLDPRWDHLFSRLMALGST